MHENWREELREEKLDYHEIKDRMNTPKEERLKKPDGMSMYEWLMMEKREREE